MSDLHGSETRSLRRRVAAGLVTAAAIAALVSACVDVSGFFDSGEVARGVGTTPTDRSQGPTSEVPSPSTASTPSFAPSAPAPMLPGEQRYVLDFGDNTVVDLDAGTAAKSGEGDGEHEVELDFGRFFVEKDDTWGQSRVVFIPTEEASFQGCERGTRMQQDGAWRLCLCLNKSWGVGSDAGLGGETIFLGAGCGRHQV